MGLDFVHDAVECGRAIRVLSVVDAYTRECLALEVDKSFGSRRVTRVLDAIIAERGQPLAIRCDSGPELTKRHFLAWCVERQVELVHISRGSRPRNDESTQQLGISNPETQAQSFYRAERGRRRQNASPVP